MVKMLTIPFLPSSYQTPAKKSIQKQINILSNEVAKSNQREKVNKNGRKVNKRKLFLLPKVLFE